MLENKDKIEVIREILYEESTRKMLLEHQDVAVESDFKVKSFVLWKWVAAASIIAILSIVGFNLLNDDSENRAQIAFNNHEFPVISKSRGTSQNTVDNHLEDINQQNYAIVLPLLDGNDLSEKDKFVKALILFRTGKYQDAQSLINATDWTDSYHRAELDWVLYLIAYTLDEPLERVESSLTEKYKVQARKIAKK